MTNQEVTKVEFLLTLEGNFIIQRFFSVPNFNPNAKKSLDLYFGIRDICDDISDNLKRKSYEFMYEDLNYFNSLDEIENIEETPEEIKKEHFLLELKLDNEVFIQRIFPAHVYHPKARYSVDIRPMVRSVLGYLTDILSTKNVETKYLNYELA